MKPIRLSRHAKEQLAFRGATENDIIDAIETSVWEAIGNDRMNCRKDFLYDKIWNDKYYKLKQVRPIFKEEAAEIVVITVYTYYL